MSKAFTKESDSPDADEMETAQVLPAHEKNYMTPQGFHSLQEEMRCLQRDERPQVVEIVAWAAGNGDRSENGDYLYGKKRLREIDRRIRYLAKQLESAHVVNPAEQQHLKQVFFGATVTYLREDDSEHVITIVGIDEADLSVGKVSWVSPIAKALLKARAGSEVVLRTPSGVETLEVLAIRYEQIPNASN